VLSNEKDPFWMVLVVLVVAVDGVTVDELLSAGAAIT
jgi:hypothetical protein